MIPKDTPAWHLTASQYCSQQGVHEPWMFEVSPAQLGMMGRQQRARYDKKRAAEWEASARCKEEWARKVLDAHRAGAFDWRNPPPEAPLEVLTLCRQEVTRQVQAAREEAWKDFQAANSLQAPGDAEVGSRVWDLAFGGYATVLRRLKKSLRVRLERDGREYAADARRFQKRSYQDLEEDFGKALLAGGEKRAREKPPADELLPGEAVDFGAAGQEQRKHRWK